MERFYTDPSVVDAGSDYHYVICFMKRIRLRKFNSLLLDDVPRSAKSGSAKIASLVRKYRLRFDIVSEQDKDSADKTLSQTTRNQDKFPSQDYVQTIFDAFALHLQILTCAGEKSKSSQM